MVYAVENVPQELKPLTAIEMDEFQKVINETLEKQEIIIDSDNYRKVIPFRI